jgi:hypothetical protein
LTLERSTDPGVIALVDLGGSGAGACPDLIVSSNVRASRRSDRRGSHAKAGPATVAASSTARPIDAMARPAIPLVIRRS